jgi:SEC-C motif-containing protein
MRSRFAAFALGLGDYLVDTLSTGHPDRAYPRADLSRALARAKETQRFLGLRIVDAAELGDTGEVLFVARIFERGRDRSFAELSQFVREEGAWRYDQGKLVPREGLPAELASVTRETFLAAASELVSTAPPGEGGSSG